MNHLCLLSNVKCVKTKLKFHVFINLPKIVVLVPTKVGRPIVKKLYVYFATKTMCIAQIFAVTVIKKTCAEKKTSTRTINYC